MYADVSVKILQPVLLQHSTTQVPVSAQFAQPSVYLQVILTQQPASVRIAKYKAALIKFPN
jgi:hypothetical protein